MGTKSSAQLSLLLRKMTERFGLPHSKLLYCSAGGLLGNFPRLFHRTFKLVPKIFFKWLHIVLNFLLN